MSKADTQPPPPTKWPQVLWGCQKRDDCFPTVVAMLLLPPQQERNPPSHERSQCSTRACAEPWGVSEQRTPDTLFLKKENQQRWFLESLNCFNSMGLPYATWDTEAGLPATFPCKQGGRVPIRMTAYSLAWDGKNNISRMCLKQVTVWFVWNFSYFAHFSFLSEFNPATQISSFRVNSKNSSHIFPNVKRTGLEAKLQHPHVLWALVPISQT